MAALTLNEQVLIKLGYKLTTGTDIPVQYREADYFNQRIFAKEGFDFYCSNCGNIPNFSNDVAEALTLLKDCRWTINYKRPSQNPGYTVDVWGGEYPFMTRATKRGSNLALVITKAYLAMVTLKEAETA